MKRSAPYILSTFSLLMLAWVSGCGGLPKIDPNPAWLTSYLAHDTPPRTGPSYLLRVRRHIDHFETYDFVFSSEEWDMDNTGGNDRRNLDTSGLITVYCLKSVPEKIPDTGEIPTVPAARNKTQSPDSTDSNRFSLDMLTINVNESDRTEDTTEFNGSIHTITVPRSFPIKFGPGAIDELGVRYTFTDGNLLVTSPNPKGTGRLPIFLHNMSVHWLFPILPRRAVHIGEVWAYDLPVTIPRDYRENMWERTAFVVRMYAKLVKMDKSHDGVPGRFAKIEYVFKGSFNADDPVNRNRFPYNWIQSNDLQHNIRGNGIAWLDWESGIIVDRRENVEGHIYTRSYTGEDEEPKELESEWHSTIKLKYLLPGTVLDDTSGKTVKDRPMRRTSW